MSTDLLTIEEAAKHLGVSDRTVRKFIADGYLSTKRDTGSRRKWLLPAEVEELRKDRIDFREGARLTRKEFMKLRARLQRLEGHMEVVLRMLDSKSEPLRMDRAYAKSLHEACLGQLQRAKWDESELSSWSQIFLRVTEEDFKSLRDATEDPKPWVPFLRLCLAMTASVVANDRYATSMDLQGVHRELAEARRRMRVSAMCYADLYDGTLDSSLRRLEPVDGSSTDLLKHVLRKP
jgi:excisionase family DNA binding protein